MIGNILWYPISTTNITEESDTPHGSIDGVPTSKDSCADLTVRLTRKDFLSWRSMGMFGQKSPWKYRRIHGIYVQRCVFEGKNHQFWWSCFSQSLRVCLNSGTGWMKIPAEYRAVFFQGFFQNGKTLNQWEIQDPKMEVLYHIRPYFMGIVPFLGLFVWPSIW